MTEHRPDRIDPEGCVFCDIIAGESPASVFYEDDVVLGLMTIGPVTTGHAMVIPKTHAPYLAQLDEEAGCQMWTVAQRVAAALRTASESSEKIRCEGVSMYLADGRAAAQEIFHVHLHVFPRYEGDPFGLVADWTIHPPREELDRIASEIQRAYDQLWRTPGKKLVDDR